MASQALRTCSGVTSWMPETAMPSSGHSGAWLAIVDADRPTDRVADEDRAGVVGSVVVPQPADRGVERLGAALERDVVGGQRVAAAMAGPVQRDHPDPVVCGSREQRVFRHVEVRAHVAPAVQCDDQGPVRDVELGGDARDAESVGVDRQGGSADDARRVGLVPALPGRERSRWAFP